MCPATYVEVNCKNKEALLTDYHRRHEALAKALPYFREGDPIPAGRDLRVADRPRALRAR